MKTAFLCGKCGSRLVAKASLAGRKSRCPKCGHVVVVPSAEASSGDWRLAVSQQLDPENTVRPGGDAKASAAPREDSDGYRLKSLTPVEVPPLEQAPARPPRPSSPKSPRSRPHPVPPAAEQKAPANAPTTKPDDELAGLFGGEDEVAFEFNPPEQVVAPSQVKNPLADVFRVYRSVFSLLARGTSGISEASYTISFILLILAIAGGMMGHYGLASLGLGLIVLLNVIGVIGDLASLVMLSFRKDPMQGLLFLLPPYAAYYIWSDWKRYQEVVGRMRIPVLMLGAVALAYAFVPWLSEDASQRPKVAVATGENGEEGVPGSGEKPMADAPVGYGVGAVEAAAEWVWSFVGGEPNQLFHATESGAAQDENADQPEE